jgi:hypothetical protein
MKSQYNDNGVVLQESGDIVVIATGLKSSSSNTKTGGMIQVYILHRHMHPIDASRTGADKKICGDCIHRGTIVDGKLTDRRCYVQIDKAPASIFRAYQRGRYRKVKSAREVRQIFSDRLARLGAYGDPAYMRLSLIRAICSVARGWTGYSHQWRLRPDLLPFVMASCDSPSDVVAAQADGWRTFRVSAYGNDTTLPGEISCPASAEAGKRTTCNKCRLCDGARPDDTRKSIVIQDHSKIKTRLYQIA